MALAASKLCAMNNLAGISEQPPNFEEALKALEAIVRQLESGEAPLDESIALYEQGNRLRALCQQRLDAAKARIEAIALNADGSSNGTQPFDAGS